MKRVVKSVLTCMLIGTFFSLSLVSCKKKPTGVDKEIVDQALTTSGYTWYKNSDAILDASSGSGHSDPKLRTRYNAIASSILNAEYKVMDGVDFPEGALIVKELYNKNDKYKQIAIAYKKASDPNADANGWLWGTYTEDGKVIISTSAKGADCISCHSRSGNTDQMLMNVSFN